MHARIKLPCGQLIQTISSNISVTLERQQPGLEQLLYDKFFNKKKMKQFNFYYRINKSACTLINASKAKAQKYTEHQKSDNQLSKS